MDAPDRRKRGSRRSSRGPGLACAILLACLGGYGHATAQDDSPESWHPGDIVPQWGVVGKASGLRTVYITPDGLRDRLFVSQVLRRVIERGPAGVRIEVLIFDDPRNTPSGRPRHRKQWEHLRARYLWDPIAQVERFVWVQVVDPGGRPPRLREREDAIGIRRPGRGAASPGRR